MYLSPVTKSKIFLKSRSIGAAPCDNSVNSVTHESGKCNSLSTEIYDFNLHKRLLNTFEGFIHQLDEIFLNLRAEENLNSDEYIPEFTSYHDICDKLRLEVLIAIDKLQLTSLTGASYNENNIEFLHKMNNLKYQLSDIRSQYHNAIKDFDFKIECDKII